MRNVCVVGLGYIGLPTASILAHTGFEVFGVDVSPLVVKAISQGEVHFHEPELDVVVRFAVESGLLRAGVEPRPADVYILAVPTPVKEDNRPDICHVEAAVHSIAPYLHPGNLVILESTSPAGTTERIGDLIRELRPDLRIPPFSKDSDTLLPEAERIYLAHCPERVLPGRVLRELVDNDRIIGGLDPASTRKAEAFYRTFVKGFIFPTDCRTAELTKLTENAFRDVNIAFANELSLICERLGIDVWELIGLANRHPRVNILQPGPGVGGHCIAVDPWFIVNSAPDEARLIRTAREVNDRKPHHVIQKIIAEAASHPNPVIACLGLAFKADIDDLRESPAMEIATELARQGAGRLLVVEPYVNILPAALRMMPGVELVDLDYALAQATVVALLVNHRQFVEIDPDVLAGKAIVDTRGVWRFGSGAPADYGSLSGQPIHALLSA